MTAPIPTTKEQIDNITSNNDAYLCHSLRNSLSTLGWVKNKKRYETLDIETKKLRRRVLTYGKLIEKGLKGINCDENPKKINKKETIYNLKRLSKHLSDLIELNPFNKEYIQKILKKENTTITIMYRSLEEIEKNPWIIGIIEKLHATNTQTDAIRDEGGLEEIMSKSMPMIVPQPNPQQPQYAYQ